MDADAEKTREQLLDEVRALRGRLAGADGAPPPWSARVLEAVSDSLFVLDRDWRFVYVNAQAARDALRLPGDLIGRPLWGEYPQLMGSPLEDHYRRAMATQQAAHFEMRGIVSGRWLEVHAYPTPDGLVVFSRDATARKWAEEALRESEERFRAFMDGGTAVAFVKDAGGRYVYVNRPFEARYGRRLGDLRGLTDFEVWPADVARAFREDDLATLAAGAAREFLESAPDPDGSVQHWHVFKFPFRDAAGAPHVGGMAVNVTAQRRGEEELRALPRRLLEAQEAERRHVACELHDEVGQALTGLRLTLELAGRSPPEGARERLEEALRLTQDLTGRVRDLSLRLRPSMLDDLGLLPALLWHLKRYTAQTGVEVAFEHRGLDGRLPAGVETAAYRIVQEALSNVARHAGADRCTVTVSREGDVLRLRVEDGGRGFDAAAAGREPSTGLSGMRERAALLGGHAAVESAPGLGTRLAFELPAGPAMPASDGGGA